MLIVGAALMAAAGLVFGFTTLFWLLVVAGTIGVISPSGQEVGPFLSIEQAALSQVVSDRNRTDVFAWYTPPGSLATALGARGWDSDPCAANLMGACRQLSCDRRRVRRDRHCAGVMFMRLTPASRHADAHVGHRRAAGLGAWC